MQEIRQLKQYSEDHFSISVRIKTNGNISSRSVITFYGEARKNWNEKNKEKLKTWRKDNKETTDKVRKKWREKNKEKIKIQTQKYGLTWYRNNKEKVKKYSQLESVKEYKKKYRNEHKKEAKEWLQNNPAKVRQYKRKERAKRRNLSFNPLNNPFKNCEGHHIDKTNVIFIPKEIHRSVSHNIWTGKNMHEINNLAIDYYWEERFKKYGVIK